ncbi:MAG: aspartate--tRNA(Asn) ligase [Acidobacteriia bacterium]|nr:aspartate--tRNA(Asn) ligase [Terriglobia bacterium]
MVTTETQRTYIGEVPCLLAEEVLLKGWVYRLRVLGKTAFLILRDCTGEAQCVMATDALKHHKLKIEDVVEIRGTVRADPRAKAGCEVDISEVDVLNRAAQKLPFQSADNVDSVGLETLLEYRPLSLRTEAVGDIFHIQAAVLAAFRDALNRRHFTEIVTSKIVASGTEGGSNLFEIKYFDRVAYLAQSPQFYKEHGVAGLERVYETGHVYRAEPHASSRHLTEYYSLDVEFGFINGPEDVIQFERELLTDMFDSLNRRYPAIIRKYREDLLPSVLGVPCWEFEACLEKLRAEFGRTGLEDDLDPLAERQLCELAARENGIGAVFVLGFPLAARPFYTAPRGSAGAAGSFDLLFEGLEITTGGQRLHCRGELESALRSRQIDPANFASHLAMFDLGMPPHGGFAIGLERLTCQILKLPNVRQAVLYPRDRYRITP